MPNADTHRETNHTASVLSPQEWTTLLVVSGVAAVATIVYFVARSYYIRPEQLIEGGLYLLCLGAAAWISIQAALNFKKNIEKSWPRVPAYIPPHIDRRNVEKAFERNAVVLGYDRKTPCLWSDEVRRMQALILGAPGSGKTTVLRNILAQDIQRVLPGGRRLPIIVVDGKGDGEFLNSLMFEIAAAGRLDDLRVLDPSRPDASVRYNPLYAAPGDSYQERANLTFESFDLADDFFKFHQENYFSDLVRVLAHTGKQMTVYDVLVMMLDEQVLREQIGAAAARAEEDSALGPQARANLALSARNLLQSLQDRERVSKIQGLINELMVFTEDDLSAITCSYDNLLVLDEVIDRGLILFVSLNTNRNARAVTALGRMLLQDLQLTVGNRYLSGKLAGDGSPLVSIILDEFAPFAYRNFSSMLQMARGSNIGFLFSLQSVAQLDSVGLGFRHSVTSAPNTIMLMKTWDTPTVKYFQEAASQAPAQRLTEHLVRRPFSGEFEVGNTANRTEIRELRVPDERIRNLPTGQMHVLMTDTKMGAPHYFLLQARRAPDVKPAFFNPVIEAPVEPAQPNPNGAYLRFKDADLLRRLGRIDGRRNKKRNKESES